MAQEAPKPARESEQRVPVWPRGARSIDFPGVFQIFWRLQHFGVASAPDGPRGIEYGPKTTQEGPKQVHQSSKTASRQPKRAPRRPMTAPGEPREGLQRDPRPS
eukprot:2399883-Pyramimonas_sp.AAC.1